MGMDPNEIKNNNKVVIDNISRVFSAIGKGIVTTSVIMTEVVKATATNVAKYYKEITSKVASGDEDNEETTKDEYKGGIN